MARSTSERLIERTFGRIRRAWRDTGRAGTTSPRSQLQLDPDLPEASLALLREQIDACLKATGGEVSARARAADLGRAYLGLNAAGRERFLRLLAREFGPDRGAIDAAIEEWRRATDDVGFQRAEARLAQALVAPRRRLLTQFNDLPDGVKFLVDLRAELLSLAAANATLEALDRDLKALLAWWFDAGFPSQPPRRSSLFRPSSGQPTENRACFAVKRNSELLNPGAFPAIAGLRGVRSPRARCKGEFGGNREFLRFRPQNRENTARVPTNKPRVTRNINDLQTFPVFLRNRETDG